SSAPTSSQRPVYGKDRSHVAKESPVEVLHTMRSIAGEPNPPMIDQDPDLEPGLHSLTRNSEMTFVDS
ncbi:MAG: hypothetical protein ACXVB5_14795, partial [Isosphaeraceae bacterium]